MSKFTNSKVTIHLKGSLCMVDRKSPFDSILAMLYFNKQKNEKIFNGDYGQRLEFLDMSSGIYHTSYPQFRDVGYYHKEVLIKKFDHSFFAKYGDTSKRKSLIPTHNGKFKNGFFSLERVSVGSVVYYVRGDMEVIEDLLKRLRFLGKKSSLGWGEIERIELEGIESDYSIFKDGNLMRNTPIENSNSWRDCSKKISLARLTHPYWLKEDLKMCYMP